MARQFVFIGGFLWAISFFMIIIDIFYGNVIDATTQSPNFVVLIPWLAGNFLSIVVAYTQLTQGGAYSYGGGESTDSIISSVFGFSLASLITVTVCLYLLGLHSLILSIGVIGAIFAFFGIILIGHFWNTDSV